jgi:hypothetical protein
MLKKFGLLFLMLGVPAVLYLVYVSIAENSYQKLPVFGPKEAFFITAGQKVADTAYHEVKVLEKSLERVNNRVRVVSLFVPGDNKNNRIRYRQLARVEDVFKDNPLIWTMHMHTEGDSALLASWTKGSPKRLTYYAGNSLVDSLEKALWLYQPDWKAIYPEAQLHELTFLIDKKQRVRGIYKTVLRKETDRLMEDIRTLIVEYANTEPKRRRR